MAKTEKDPLQKITMLAAKALQRGEKLERTLTKLLAHLDPGSATEEFLKALQAGLKTVRKDVKSMERNISAASRKAQKDKSKKSENKPAKRKAVSKKPAAADIAPLPEAGAGG